MTSVPGSSVLAPVAAPVNAAAGPRIELAEPGDTHAVAQVHVRSWQSAYREQLPAAYLETLSVEKREAGWRDFLAQGRSTLLVARCAGQLRGFVAFGPSRDAGAAAGTAEVFSLYLDPEVWSAGVGRALWLAALQRLSAQACPDVTLWVLASNVRAIRFYEAAGFRAEPQTRKTFELGGATVEEIRYTRTVSANSGTG